MFQSTKIARALIATVALFMVVGCMEQAPPPPAAAAPGPELAGAWYQIYFDTNGSTIDARGQMIVKNVAYVVDNNDSTRVTVIGKTDRIGAPPANVALSKRRADTVRDALIAAGVPAARIDTSWTGEAQLQVATANDVNEPRNRVVDVTVVKEAP
jgi:peptidoglycan-associated lipoprotein